MDGKILVNLDLQNIPTPCFIVDESAIDRNLAILQRVQDRTGCKILLALKAFSMFSIFPKLGKTLKGACASSPHEARLAREEFGGEVHTFSAAYSPSDLKEVAAVSDFIVFNSFSQWNRFKPIIFNFRKTIRCGMRVNPEHSEAPVAMYDPCAPHSRLGVRPDQLDGQDLRGITGLHFHTLCEQNADALERTLAAVESKFGRVLHSMKWLNLGGGHHITRHDYDVDLLCRLIHHLSKTYDVEVYLEPGEAVALNAGVLAATVLDIVDNKMQIAILDASAATHMPDVLEMPYRPVVIGAGLPGERAYSYRLAGPSCLAGDVIGDYSFDSPLKVGDKVVFEDMAHYTMVKTNTFNGINLPSIALYDPAENRFTLVREFGYEDFKARLS
ncbi:MAG: carboxynorspermidine decarboxylase [Desulfobacterales bacterium]|jgi:carboxynorspermidine decarboxylase|nr:carboxynorspermidine decarboxylase [Desulfobacterales bacterium]